MGRETASATGVGATLRPPKILKTRRARLIWRYLIDALDYARLDYRSALMSIALLADKVDTWRTHADNVHKYGWRYDEDSNGGSLESDESRAERRSRIEILRDLDESGLTVLAVAQVRQIDLMTNQGELFSPFDLVDQIGVEAKRLPDPPPWTMRPAEKRIWNELLPTLDVTGFDFSTAGLSLGLLCTAIVDWQDCKDWIEDNKGKTFAVARDTGRTYEVSASYNRAKIASQIRVLLKKNGMTVMSCAKNKAISKGRIISEELADILSFIQVRPT
ncbi:hypothetical protein [Jeongeupia sp. USM3]|uniref:hypothetical protein n=1 Tax=Jeongeupia sp. USM3 TaxID=1906741 RepID=UPI00089DE674|nr:hypothetical protein [Jeongeupia sp. USM3]AOY00111.1 hypothetical protein BJP62_06390 [Jeongeupia sp. USM3]